MNAVGNEEVLKEERIKGTSVRELVQEKGAEAELMKDKT